MRSTASDRPSTSCQRTLEASSRRTIRPSPTTSYRETVIIERELIFMLGQALWLRQPYDLPRNRTPQTLYCCTQSADALVAPEPQDAKKEAPANNLHSQHQREHGREDKP